MSDFQSFIDMGGYAVYVWSAYTVTFIVLLLNVYAAKSSHDRAKREIARSTRSRATTSGSQANADEFRDSANVKPDQRVDP